MKVTRIASEDVVCTLILRILPDTIHYPKFSKKEANQTYGNYGHTFQVKYNQEFSSIYTHERGHPYTRIIYLTHYGHTPMRDDHN